LAASGGELVCDIAIALDVPTRLADASSPMTN
jgi:hypothetical protein